MRTCELSLASFTVSGCQTDALVSDYSSKSKSSTGEGKVRLFGVSNLSTYHNPRSRGGSAHSERQLGSAVRGAPTAW
jgi:hypothetical protein